VYRASDNRTDIDVYLANSILAAAYDDSLTSDKGGII